MSSKPMMIQKGDRKQFLWYKNLSYVYKFVWSKFSIVNIEQNKQVK